MLLGKNVFTSIPDFYLCGAKVKCVSSMDILGYTFSHNGTFNDHINNRVRKGRAAFYSCAPKGLNITGFTPYVKANIYKSVCQSTLEYGLGVLDVSKVLLNQLNTQHSNMVKMSMGLSKRARTTALLGALNVKTIHQITEDRTLSVWRRTFLTDSLFRKLCFYTLDQFYKHKIVFKGTLLSRVSSYTGDVLNPLLKKPAKPHKVCDGVLDSIQTVFNTYVLSPKSVGQNILQLLTSSF